MPDTEKKTIPRGPAATAAKNKYRDSNYDRMELAVPKGMKARIKEIAKEQGYSQNNYVVEAVKEKYQRDTGKKLDWKENKEDAPQPLEDQKEIVREAATAAGMEIIEK